MRSEQKTEGQPTLRGHQLKTRSPMDLRAGLLSAGGRRESDKGIARRHADRPDQLLELFGKHIPGATDGGGLCADARDAASPGTDPPRPLASRGLARTFSKTRCPSRRHGTSHRSALAASVSLPR